MSGYSVRIARWNRDRMALRDLRQRVFVDEQGVPAALEWDGLDNRCSHVIAVATDDTAIGTARITPDGQIGRMAVLAAWRHQGVGARILALAVDICRERYGRVPFLHAQVAAIGFYRRFGFVARGAIYEEAGIAHRTMRLQTGTDQATQ